MPEPSLFTAALAGFFLCLGLIVAIGAQNAFILRQGLRGEHVFWVCLTCAICDAFLITLGVTSLKAISAVLPGIEPVLRYGGATFLLAYGLRSMRSAWRGGNALDAGTGQGASLKATLATLLAITFLNPHVYLDTVILIGSIATNYPGHEMAFAAGASLGSIVFFFTLGYGARLLRPLFAKPASWQVLDGLIAMVMTGLAVKLVV
ncbi:LysE/ArgO family amino acid transporter [Pannonibacter phragmitetus]|uniref:LysE/ArgO family amino acid transporter n=1 Tax=Pannonibacter phragmitetus TaxID=121719 RepID=UPI003D7D8E1C